MTVRRSVLSVLTTLAAFYGLGFWLIGPRFDHSASEWAFYKMVGQQVPRRARPLLYFMMIGIVTHTRRPSVRFHMTWLSRLYYLERSASWYCDLEELTNHLRLRSPEDETSVPRPPAFVIGRDRDLPALQALGRVGVSGRSEGTRWDRKYILMRIWPFRDQRMQTQANSSSSDR